MKRSEDFVESPEYTYGKIKSAVETALKLANFDDIPPLVKPTFSISEEEIKLLEEKVRQTLIKNDNAAGVEKSEKYNSFLEWSVRIGVNYMLENEDDPILQYYLKEIRKGGILCKKLFLSEHQ